MVEEALLVRDFAKAAAALQLLLTAWQVLTRPDLQLQQMRSSV